MGIQTMDSGQHRSVVRTDSSRSYPLGAVMLALACALGRAGAETVTWVGPASGDWSATANWSTGRLPGPADDVVTATGAAPYIHHPTGETTLRSLTLAGSLDLAGGSLTLSQASTIGTHLIVAAGATLTVAGRAASLTVSGKAFINGGALIATGGAQIRLPSASQYADAGLLRAQGPDSRIELAGLPGLGEVVAAVPDLNQGVSRSVSVYQGVADNPNPLTDLTQAVSRGVSVYQGATDSPNPLVDLTEAISRGVSVYQGVADSTNPLADLGEAVSRGVSVYQGVADSPNPLADLTQAVSRAVSVGYAASTP